MDSSPSKSSTQPSLPSTAGVKRPAPSLLPAFEPFSSSPGFPRPSKRQQMFSPSRRDAAFQKYPTPVPTSTTGILSSSPPRIPAPRPLLQRTVSSVSERAPLSAVPSINLPENGEEVLMGRSSNLSHFQLSTNHLVSRVHVKARYIAATEPLEENKVEIVCCGWNGVKLHCHGRTWELAKGDTFTSATETAEIMLDVPEARVRIVWPTHERALSVSAHTDSSWDDENSPRARIGAVNSRGQTLQSSPLRMDQRLVSPESPTPVGPLGNSKSKFSESDPKPIVEIYEDENPPSEEKGPSVQAERSQISTVAGSQPVDLGGSQTSELTDPDEEDPDEENDPIVHSFGPFGSNLTRHMEESFITLNASPVLRRGLSHGRVRRVPAVPPQKRSSSESTNDAETIPVVNHVINQLAFSRLSSTPISVILNNLPAALKGISPSSVENLGLSRDDLHKLLLATPCIGEIHREGKDAAGKALESEYYYIPDEDHDVQRRAAVVDGLRKPSLRNCRKQHKQYYWKKPKTP